MSTNNAVNVGLSGSTGTGTFVGATSPTITTPRIAQINDTNGAALFVMSTTASAVNAASTANAPTGQGPLIYPTGSDSNIPLDIQGKGTAGIILRGYTDGSTAGSGSRVIGEVISSTVTAASATVLTATATAQTVTSITVDAGDWDIYANAGVNSDATLVWMDLGISTVDNTLPNLEFRSAFTPIASLLFGVAVAPSIAVSVAGNTTYYIVVRASFTNNATMYGNIWARRRR